MHIRDYLIREARRITDGALAGCTDAAAWAASAPARRRALLEMLGLSEAEAAPGGRPPSVVTGTVERPTHRIERLSYESLPGLHVTANLYLPARRAARVPAVLYLCGHADGQKVHYQAHARRLAQLGCACLIVDTIAQGEVRGVHHGCHQRGWFHWYSRGYTPAGVETLNAIRGLDLLAARPEVDPERLGVTGASGGGAITWFTAAVDGRIRAAAPSCATGTLASHVADRTVDQHCDCMWWINTARWDLTDVGGLIAPRPLLLASADRDALYTIESIREAHARLARAYAALGAADRLRLVEVPGRHAYHARSRTEIFAWLLRHLDGRDVTPETVGDLDDSPTAHEPADVLRVFAAEAPAGNRVATIHDERAAPARVAMAADPAARARERDRVVAALRARPFAHFPAPAPALEARADSAWEYGGHRGVRFSFVTEEGWRLAGKLVLPHGAGTGDPVVVVLRSPGERSDDEADDAMAFLDRAGAAGPRAVVEPRGTGASAWGEELGWHLRRAAAWTGRTMASLRVWDALRALAAVRALPEAAGRAVVLAARGEMAVIALYAALLDGDVSRLVLEQAPATLDAASRPDGRGPAIELLGALAVADLPAVIALIGASNIRFMEA